MWRRWLQVTGVVIVSLACAAPSWASTFVLMSESDLTARSIAAVTGWVTDIEAAEDATSHGINTYVHIEPDQVVFGSLPEGALILREPGGRVRGRSEWIFGSPEYSVGEEVFVFLSQNADGTLRTTGLSMGKFTIEADARGVFTALRHLGEGAALWDLKHGTLISNPGPESYDLTGLLAAVRAAAPAHPTHDFTRRTSVTTTPPELSHLAVREHQEAFTYLSTPSRWFEPDSGQPIPYLIDANGDVGIGAATSRAAINDAFGAWTNVPTSDLTLIDGGSLAPIAFAGCDGGNRIVFNDLFNDITDPVGCSGVLAIGGFCASAETRVVNGTNFRRIRVGKITFNNGWSSCPGWNRCNLSEVATHELGHTLGFGHTTDPNATMYATAHFDGRCAALRADDLAAINFVYPRSGTPVPSPTATPAPPTATPTRTRTATATRALTPTVPTATVAPTRTATATSVATPTLAVPPTRTATGTATPSNTATAPAAATNTPTPGRHGVHGRIHYYSSDRGVPNVTVSLRGETQDATQTSTAGDYGFDGVPPGTWELAAEKASDFGEGVTPLDAVYVLQAVANLRTLDASQRLACDVTGDGQLSALDAVRILQFSVGTMARLPVGDTCGSDWSFVPEPGPMQQRSVIDPSVGPGTCHDGKIMLEGLLDDAPDQDFRAILFGDCTGNWDSSHSAALGRSVAAARAPHVRLGRPTTDGAVVQMSVFVRSPAPYNALDLRIAYDPSRLVPTGVAMQRQAASGLTSFYSPESGLLRVAMANSEPIKRRFGVLLTLQFQLAAGASDPGEPQALSARIDELPAVIAGTGALGR